MNVTIGYWRTKDGRKARVLCTDSPVGLCMGYVLPNGNLGKEPPYIMAEWSSSGMASGFGPGMDLSEAWVDPPKKVKMWKFARKCGKCVWIENGQFYACAEDAARNGQSLKPEDFKRLDYSETEF